MSLNLAIVEDEITILTLTTAALQNLGHNIIGSATTGSEALFLALENQLDCLILDIDLGHGPSGIDIAVLIRKTFPKLGILFFSGHRDLNLLEIPPEISQSCAFVSKESLLTLGVLESGLEKALELTKIQNQSRESQKFSVTHEVSKKLSKNDYALLELIAAGYSNKEIAATKMIAVKSCENSIARIAKKLGISQTSENNQRILLAKTFQFLSGKASTSTQ